MAQRDLAKAFAESLVVAEELLQIGSLARNHLPKGASLVGGLLKVRFQAFAMDQLSGMPQKPRMLLLRRDR